MRAVPSLVNPRRPVVVAIAVAVAAAGCAGLPKHEVNVSTELRNRPVKSVFIFPPVFPEKVKRFTKADLKEMLPDNQAASADRILLALSDVVATSITVDSSYRPDQEARDWAAAIGLDLCKERIPLGVEPHPMPVESVLIVGAVKYGREIDQVQVKSIFTGEKTYKVGDRKWNHVCDLQAVLVDPRTGHVLFDVRQESELNDPSDDPKFLDRAARQSAWTILSGFPVKPAEEEEPAAEEEEGETGEEEEKDF